MSGDDPDLYFQRHVFMCTNRRAEGHERGCCAEKKAELLRGYLKQRAKEDGVEGVRINTAGCLDRCELGPTMVIYPEGVWYKAATVEDLEEILEVHIKGGGRISRLLLEPADGPRKLFHVKQSD